MLSENVICVENVGKCFHIYQKPYDRLKQLLGISKTALYDEFWALRGVSLTVKKGETIGIIGRNGSGKSTLLQMICGTLSKTEGDIEIHGRVAALLELGAGFNPDFTGRENIYMNGAILGLSKQEIESKYDEIVNFADIGNFIEQPVKTYSSGMYVRLAFSIQACIEPDILIIDEALAVGDEKFQRKCFARLDRLRNDGTSILFVSHSSDLIIQLCDRVLLLENGERLLLGKPEHTVRAYQKMIYAPVNDYPSIKRQIKMSDGMQDTTYASHDSSFQELDIFQDTNAASFYDETLRPETSVNYSIQGAELVDIKILNSGGQKVNILQAGSEYTFVINGNILTEARKIHFGVHIRSITGTVLTGQRYPSFGKSIEFVSESSSFEVRFNFIMSLLPGTYFVGGGIWSENEPQCLHRVLDKIMFKVMPVLNQTSFGIVDASKSTPILSIC